MNRLPLSKGLLTSVVVAALAAACAAAHAEDTPNPSGPPPGIKATSAKLAELLARTDHFAGHFEGSTRIEHWTLTSGGVSGTRVIVVSGEDRREDLALGTLTSSSGTFKGVGWEQDENGITRTLHGIHQRDERNVAALHAATKASHDVRLLGEVTTPVQAYVVEVNPKDGREEYLFFDRGTALLVRSEAVRDGQRVVTTYDDFRKAEGRTIAWHVHASDGRPGNDYDAHLASLDSGVPVDAATLAMPPSRHALFSVEDGPVKLPAHLVDDRIIVRVTLGNRPVNLLLDSGSSGIVVDKDVLDALGVKPIGSWTGATAGTYQERLAVVKDLRIGPLQFGDTVVSGLPYGDVMDDGSVVGGLLGFEFFASCVVHIDYLHGTVEVLDPEHFSPPSDATPVPIVLDDGVPTLAAGIGEATAEHMIVDTGADRSMLFSTFAGSHLAQTADQGLGEAIVASFPFEHRIQGVGGKVTVRPRQVAGLSIGRVHLPRWLFYVSQNAPSFESEDEDGLVGQDFLRNFDVYLDYRAERLYFRPNERFKSRWPEAAAALAGSGGS